MQGGEGECGDDVVGLLVRDRRSLDIVPVKKKRQSIDLSFIRYDRRCYFNVRSKADISQLNLPHGLHSGCVRDDLII